MEERQTWSSQFAFIVAAIGSAVGLGNIWRFPYIMGQNGGAVFLIVYLLLIFFVCSIPLMAELILGKSTQKDAVNAFISVNPKLETFGWLNIITSVLIPSFYFVVGGWIIFYILKSFSLGNISDFNTYFSNFISLPYLPVILTFVFLFACIFFVSRGVNKGIEIANKIMMPIFGLILISLTIVSLNLPNAQLGLEFMFKPDFSKLSPSMILAALGQALFTLSIGMGAILTYGSYLRKKDNILKCTWSIIIADTLFALLAGIMIFPAVFSFGLEPTSGAGLVFITMPKIFTQIQYGSIISIAFFFLLFFAALTSGISMVEVAVASIVGKYKFTRLKASLIVFAIIGLLAIPISLSFGILKDFTFLNRNLFDWFDFTTSNILLPFNTCIVCLVVGWLLDIKHKQVFTSQALNNIFIFMLKYILPSLLIALIIVGLI